MFVSSSNFLQLQCYTLGIHIFLHVRDIHIYIHYDFFTIYARLIWWSSWRSRRVYVLRRFDEIGFYESFFFSQIKFIFIFIISVGEYSTRAVQPLLKIPGRRVRTRLDQFPGRNSTAELNLSWDYFPLQALPQIGLQSKYPPPGK